MKEKVFEFDERNHKFPKKSTNNRRKERVKFFRKSRTSSSCQPCPQYSYASRRPPLKAAGHKQCSQHLSTVEIVFYYLCDCRPEETHLLFVLLLDLLQVGPQVHVDCVLGAQQSFQHGVGWHTHFLQSGLLHACQVDHFDLQIIDLSATRAASKSHKAKGGSEQMFALKDKPIHSRHFQSCSFIQCKQSPWKPTQLIICVVWVCIYSLIDHIHLCQRNY